eukprot:3143859-Pleurochrysis_carterae.AAC.1
MDALKDRFTPAERGQWLSFFQSYPAKVEDVPADRLHPFSSSSIPPCSLQVPSDFALDNHQGQYAESIRYINPISGTQATATQLNRARAEQQDVPVLLRGSVICILPPEDVLDGVADAGQGEHIPFWLALITSLPVNMQIHMELVYTQQPQRTRLTSPGSVSSTRKGVSWT